MHSQFFLSLVFIVSSSLLIQGCSSSQGSTPNSEVASVSQELVIGGRSYQKIQGDILIPLSPTRELVKTHDHWYGVIPFVIDSGVPAPLKTRIQEAIREWQDKAGIPFVNRTTHTDYIKFSTFVSEDGFRGFSPVGRQRGETSIILVEGAARETIVHEIGHALGLWHEHTRPDRDCCIKLYLDNVEDYAKPAFKRIDEIFSSSEYGYYGPYDVASIMHYGGVDSSIAVDRSKPTHTRKDGGAIPWATSLSAGDINAVWHIFHDAWYYRDQSGKTSIEETDANYEFASTDWNKDGFTDLVMFKKKFTGSMSTEVHIYSGAKGFKEDLLHTGTALHETDGNFSLTMADWNRDGMADMVAFRKKGGGSTEVHIYSGATNFSTVLLHASTALPETDSTFWLGMADWNRDGAQDMIAVKKSRTGSRMTEVHIYSGATTFKTALMHTATALHETDQNYDFVLNRFFGDGIVDLFAIRKTSGTKRTEIHILSGGDNFSRFIDQRITQLPETNSNFAFVSGAFGIGPEVLAIQKAGSGSTEVFSLATPVTITFSGGGGGS